MAEFFRVRNLEKYQHYSDRRPPWIKLYRDLWDDPRFFDLSESDRYVLIALFVLASQHENKVSVNQKWLKAQLLTNRAIPLERLIATGWLERVEQDAITPLADSTPLAERYPSRARVPETETETDIQRQRQRQREKKPAPSVLEISGDMEQFAREHGVTDVLRETEAMLDHFRAKGESRSDWLATWRNWMRRSKNFNRNGGRSHESKTDFNRREAEKLLSRFDSEDSGRGFGGDF